MLVTGSRGQVGGWLKRSAPKEVNILEVDVKPPVGIDIRSAEARDLVARSDVVIHAAAQIDVAESVRNPGPTMDVNVEGTRNLLQGLRPGSHFVFISSAAVYGEPRHSPVSEDHPLSPLSPYGESKIQGEGLVKDVARQRGASFTIVRPFNIYSSLQDPRSPYSGVISIFLDRSTQGKPLLIHGDGAQTRDFIHASDVAELLWKCCFLTSAKEGTFNACTGRTTSILQLAQACIGLTKSPAPIVFGPARKGDIHDSCGNPSLARQRLAWHAEHDLRWGLTETLGKTR